MKSNKKNDNEEETTLICDLLKDIINEVEKDNLPSAPCCSSSSNDQNQDEIKEIYNRTNNNNNNHIDYINTQSDVNLIIPPKIVKSSNLPPSYSSVLKMGPPLPQYCRYIRSAEGPQFGPNIRTIRSTIAENSFVARVAPPSYAEIHGDWSIDLSHHSSEELVLGPEPTMLWCSRCRAVVLTTIQCQRTKFTHFVAATLCIFLCWPCCLIPYCTNSCQTIYHICPFCNYVFGTYTPW